MPSTKPLEVGDLVMGEPNIFLGFLVGKIGMIYSITSDFSPNIQVYWISKYDKDDKGKNPWKPNEAYFTKNELKRLQNG